MAAAPGLDWARSSNQPSAPDAASSMVPGRPIRPLPKRRLRSRLSEEQAESIVYPPAPSSSSPIYDPAAQSDRTFNATFHSGNGQLPPAAFRHQDYHYGYDGEHSELGSEEDRQEHPPSKQRASWPGGVPFHRGAAPQSAASSADSHESFENTNNKKKRKNEKEGPWPSDLDGSVGQYYGSGSVAATGHVAAPGSARGRNVKPSIRSTKDRQPLSTSTSAVNAPTNSSQAVHFEQNANSQAAAGMTTKRLSEATHGQENNLTSLPSAGTSNHANNFTFTYPSNSSTKLHQTANSAATTGSRNPPGAGSARNLATQGTQTSQQLPNAAHGKRQQAVGAQPPAQSQIAQEPVARPPPPGHEYRIAAKQRQRQQEANNYRTRLRRDDVWICEFCEYEAIFGRKPRALMRQYETKDLKKRQEAENRRRLLEKAKAKSRKNKKSSKGQGKNAAASLPSQDPAHGQHYDPQYDSMAGHDSQSPGDEFYDDEYDDGPLPGHPDDYGDVSYDDEYPPPLDPAAHTLPSGHGYNKAIPGH